MAYYPKVLSLPRPMATLAPLGLVGAAALLYGTYVERYRLRLRTLEVAVAGLPPAFDGYRIVQLSDFHMGGRGWSAEIMRRAVALALEQRGDLIALTGDFVEDTPAIAACAQIFRPLRAPDGVLAVLGNHDYHDAGVRIPALVQALEEIGVRVLRNESHALRRAGQELWLVGVDDPYSGHDFLPAALKGVPAEARPIMLVHYPDFSWQLAPGRWALVLSGHSHGAQVRLPLIAQYAKRRIANTRFSHGMYRINRNPVWVTTGIGTSGRPIRLLAPPEVVVVRLRAAPIAGHG